MSQIDEALAGVAGSRTLSRPTGAGADGSRPDYVLRHPASLGAPPSAFVERWRLPTLAVAGLLLLTAAAMLEGYRSLDLISASRLYPPALVFAALMVSVSLFLTRSPRPIGRQPARTLVAVAGGGLVAATVVQMAVGRPWSTELLGAYDLLLAALTMAAAVIGGEILSR